jgi:hypothetical protein
VATLAFAAALVLRPGDRSLALDAYAALVGLAAIHAVAGRQLAAAPLERQSESEQLLALRAPPERRLAELEQLERAVELATHTAFDTHFRLRPTLVRIAEARLARRGVALRDAEPLLAPEAWELVRPDRERPAKHNLPGASAAEIRAAVDSLAAL